MKTVYAAASLLLLLASPALACTQHLECGAGAHCVKSTGAIYGQCVRDVMPQSALEGPSPLAGTAATAAAHCTFDGDCGAGSVCLKTSGNAAGMCIKEHAAAAPAR